MILQIIGFAALCIFGCYLIFAGVAGAYIGYGFSGSKDSFFMLIFAIVGALLIWFAFWQSPFTISVAT